MEWTAEQQAIINHSSGHAIVTAVAGSGKTSTLVDHILKQLERGHDPLRILVLMFNTSAKRDFERKLGKRASEYQALPEIRTYHSMGLKLYRNFIRRGLLPAFTGDPMSEKEMDFQCWETLKVVAPAAVKEELRHNKAPHVEALKGFIDLVKSTTSTPDAVFEKFQLESKQQYLIDAFGHFEQWRKANCRITYADMLYEPVMLMCSQPEVVSLVADRMDIMLVDEYQDTNEVQHRLLQFIAGRRAQVMAIGDPDQTIYEFRGASPEYILHTFAQDFPEPARYSLSYTFRYGHRLSLLANHLITGNSKREDVLCVSHETTPATAVEHIQLSGTDEQREQLTYIRSVVEQRQQQGLPLSEVAVLVRLWSQSVPLELGLLEAGISYQSGAGNTLFERQEIRRLMLLLEMAAGYLRQKTPEQRENDLWELMQFPHIGIRHQDLRPAVHSLAQAEQNYGHKLARLKFGKISRFQQEKVETRYRLWQRFERKPVEGKGGIRAGALLRRYIEQTELYKEIQDSAFDRERADEQISTIKGFVRFLQNHDVDASGACELIAALRERGHEKGGDRLLLTSIHKAKGLEWPVVILPGLTAKNMPYMRPGSESSEELIESERRLLYVAMTRAKSELHLLTVKQEKSFSFNQDDSRPSRFMREMMLDLACDIGDLLSRAGQSGKGWLSKLKHTLSPVARRYLQQVAPDAELPEETASVENDESKPCWERKLVIHSVLGEGKVISESGKAFEVKFGDGKTYNFSKQSAHLFFS
ncbi:ATP-dependent helicase [Spongorhabdus nitratireducens]